MERLLNVTTGLGVAVILLVLISVRRAHIRVEYSVTWLAAGILLVVMSRNDSMLAWLAKLMGVADPPLALLLLILLTFVGIFWIFSLRMSALRDTNIELVQRLAILELKLRALHEERER